MNELKDQAVLVKFTRSTFGLRVMDKEVSNKVDDDYEAKDAGIFYKKIFSNANEIKAIFSKLADGYSYHRKYTLPWLDDGLRILSADYIDTYSERMSQIKRELDDLLTDLEPKYHKICQDDLFRLGKLAKNQDYPDFADFKRSIKISVRFFPVPDSGDFRVAVGAEAKKELDDLIEETKIKCKAEIYNRAKGALNRVIDSLSKEKPRVHQSLLDNLYDLGDVMKHLNLHKDNEIDKLSKDLIDLANSTNIDELRREEIERQRFIKYTNDLLMNLERIEVSSAPKEKSLTTESVL